MQFDDILISAQTRCGIIRPHGAPSPVQYGSSRTLYVDGVMVGTDRPTPPASSTGGLNIGAGKSLDAGTFWSGLIDDVRLYGGAIKP